MAAAARAQSLTQDQFDALMNNLSLLQEGWKLCFRGGNEISLEAPSIRSISSIAGYAIRSSWSRDITELSPLVDKIISFISNNYTDDNVREMLNKVQSVIAGLEVLKSFYPKDSMHDQIITRSKDRFEQMSKALSIGIKRADVRLKEQMATMAASIAAPAPASNISDLKDSDLKVIVNAIVNRLITENLWEFEGVFRESAKATWVPEAKKILQTAVAQGENLEAVVNSFKENTLGLCLTCLLKNICGSSNHPELFADTQLPVLLKMICASKVCLLKEKTLPIAFPAAQYYLQ